MRYGELIMEFIYLVISIIYLIATYSIGRGPVRFEIGPALWPRMLLICMPIISIILIIKEIKFIKQEKYKKVDEQVRTKQVILTVFITFFYFFFLNYIGFILSTIALLLCYMYFMGNIQKKWHIVIIPILFTLSISFLFGRMMNIKFPRGYGIIREISYLFY